MRVVVAFDKFRGTATAHELVAGVAAAVTDAGGQAIEVPLADGGEGSLAAVGGANKRTVVTGPLGDPVEAAWRLDRRVGFIEMAAASGLAVVGGHEQNDPIAADTLGTGELISTAIELGARTIYVFLGGSATTDGGWGAIRGMPPKARMKEIELIVACDVDTRFADAARVFGPQKGASPAQVELLSRRLQRLIQVYRDEFDTDVSEVLGAGAAGGLAGGLLAMGAHLEPGFEIIAERVGLDHALEGADLVITGEGRLDAESFNGKVVGGVADWARAENVPVLAVVGAIDPELGDVPDNVEVLSLVDVVGTEMAMSDPVGAAVGLVSPRLGHR